MKVGSTLIDIVSDGTILLDGGALFGQIPKTLWEVNMKPDRKNRVRLGMNCLLIQTPDKTVLVDTGSGSKRTDKLKDIYGLNGNRLLKRLKGLNVTARDIDAVVLTHLHFDHSGGCTKLDRSGNGTPTFSKARHIVQKASWDEANNPNERSKSAYFTDDFIPIQEAGLLDLLEGDAEICPGVNVKVTNAHTPGHQIILIEAGSERIAYLGDLIPTPYHLALPHIAAFDYSPNDTLEQKRELLRTATSNGWMLIFGHSLEQSAGYVEERNGKINFTPVDF
jgi:glyoxylase-like metal-dependent hydrolase (beta-lactamase superfamily II)